MEKTTNEEEVIVIAVVRAKRNYGRNHGTSNAMNDDWKRTWASATKNQKAMKRSTNRLVAKDRIRKKSERTSVNARPRGLKREWENVFDAR